MARVTHNFEDKVILITGVSSGIGLATALAFAECGAKLVLGDISAEASDTEATITGLASGFHDIGVYDGV